MKLIHFRKSEKKPNWTSQKSAQHPSKIQAPRTNYSIEHKRHCDDIRSRFLRRETKPDARRCDLAIEKPASTFTYTCKFTKTARGVTMYKSSQPSRGSGAKGDHCGRSWRGKNFAPQIVLEFPW